MACWQCFQHPLALFGFHFAPLSKSEEGEDDAYEEGDDEEEEEGEEDEEEEEDEYFLDEGDGEDWVEYGPEESTTSEISTPSGTCHWDAPVPPSSGSSW